MNSLKKMIANNKVNKLVKKYGEYDVPFSEIKKLDCYCIDYSMSLEEIKRMIKECDEHGCSELVTSDNVIINMELGNFDIEFTQYGINDITNNLESGFYCCANYKTNSDDGWQSEGFSELETSIDLFNNKDELEEKMYNAMIKYMKEDGFTWSKEN